jgi:hypothetical protein
MEGLGNSKMVDEEGIPSYLVLFVGVTIKK